jgi:hypothetical protein
MDTGAVEDCNVASNLSKRCVWPPGGAAALAPLAARVGLRGMPHAPPSQRRATQVASCLGSRCWGPTSVRRVVLCPALQARAPSPQAARRYRTARGRAQARDRAAGTAVFTSILKQYNPRVLPPHHATVPHHRRGATTRQEHRDGLPQDPRLRVGLAGAARARPAAGTAAGEPRRHGTNVGRVARNSGRLPE